MRSKTIFCTAVGLLLILSINIALASDWPSWRGPNQNGVSSETGLISSWSADGENLIWKADFMGRSTPVVLNGRVYVIGRVGKDITEQERVACFDAETGEMLWEHRFNVFQATARVLVVPNLPWSEDFESIEVGKNPSHWIGATVKFVVQEIDGNKVLVKPPAARGLDRSNVYLGPSTMSNYTIQVDLLGTKNKRRRPDMGLIANRYTLDMMGNHQRLQISVT